ncbi:MAG: ABC transporter permease subunit [Streptosporangiaceae bacterium]|nr:ABC transporter permease subunit [Streptosporangiaceae bacterium]MBV9857350.1 ABC transporter permease subunit [Streptosporangiaceae bacterium]
MTWVTWRQHRGQAMVSLAVLAGLALALFLVSEPMRQAFGQDGITGCVARGTRTAGCQNAIGAFLSSWGFTYNQALIALLIIPGLIGVIIGAPLLGRELEEGTWRMAWSQTVPRTRWLVSKLALVSAGLVAFGAALTGVFTWYRAPMDQLTGHFTEAAYDFEGLCLTASLLCSFAFAVLAGLAARRSIAGMVAAFLPWLALRGLTDLFLRQHLAQPLAKELPASASIAFGPNTTSMTGNAGDWVLGATRAAGHVFVTYQPAGRFWTFQAIEAGGYLTLAAAALGGAVWLLHRRAA